MALQYGLYDQVMQINLMAITRLHIALNLTVTKSKLYNQ